MARRGVQIHVTGDKKLQRKFGQMPRRTQNKAVRKGLREGAWVVAHRARKVAPKDTGLMARKITVRRARMRKRGVIGVQAATGTRKAMGIEADSQWYYPAIVQYGAPQRNLRPRPFMDRAWIETQDEAIAKGRDAINRQIVILWKR